MSKALCVGNNNLDARLFEGCFWYHKKLLQKPTVVDHCEDYVAERLVQAPEVKCLNNNSMPQKKEMQATLDSQRLSLTF